jgi:molybdopterin converting factor small subunit
MAFWRLEMDCTDLVQPTPMLSFRRVRLLFSGSFVPLMHVEFFGVPRERAGTSRLEVQADTLGQLLRTLVVQFPSFDKLMGGTGPAVRLHPAFVANLNGDRFVSDPGTPLNENDCVLILSADAGG